MDTTPLEHDTVTHRLPVGSYVIVVFPATLVVEAQRATFQR